jgi:hypothetical protein
LSHASSVFFVLVDFSANITKTNLMVYPGAACTPVCQRGHRDTALIEITSLGGNLGFGASSGGNTPVGTNCLRFIVSFVQATLLCIDFDVFFSNGTQATQAQVRAGLVPIVTLPRFFFPVPNNSPICFALGLNDTNTHCIGDDFGNVIARAFPQTIPDTYRVHIVTSASVLVHDLGFINVLVPQPPQMVGLHFKSNLSLAKNGNAQTFRIDVFNPNAATTLSVIIRINAIADDKTTTINLASTVQTVTPLQTIRIFLTAPLSTATIGLTFTIAVTLQWGVPPFTLTARSIPDVSGFQHSGTFTVLP